MSATLGKCVAEYKASRAGLAKVVVIMLASFAIAIGICTACVRGGPGDVGGRVVIFVLGLLCSIPGLLCVYGLTRGRNNALRVHEHGVAIRQAGQETSIAWDDIASYQKSAFLVLETNDGDVVTFGMLGLDGAGDIMATLERELVTLRALPRWRTMLRDGQSIELDGATFDATGITLAGGETRVPWTAITACAREEIDATTRGKAPSTRVAIQTSSNISYIPDLETSEADAIVALCKDRMTATG